MTRIGETARAERSATIAFIRRKAAGEALEVQRFASMLAADLAMGKHRV